MTETEGTSEIFAAFNERHIEIIAKIDDLRIDIQHIFPEIASEDAESSQNSLKNLLWVWDEQEKEIANLRNELLEKSINTEISGILTPEKSESAESGSVQEIWDFEEPWISDKSWKEVAKKLKLHLAPTSPSDRCSIDEMLLFGNRNFLSIWRNGHCDLKIPNREGSNSKRQKALIRILQYIFEICHIQVLVVYDLPDNYDSIFEGVKFPPIRVRNFYSKSLADPTMAILKSCEDNIQSVEFDAFDSSESKLQRVTSVTRVPRMHFLNMNGISTLCTILIKNWVYKHPDIGAELSIQQIGEFDVGKFFGSFRKHVFRQHGRWELEVKTSEAKKNVLIQLFPSTSIIKCTVVHPGAIGVVYA